MYVNVNLMVGILIRITANADVTVKIWNNIMYTKKKKKMYKKKKKKRKKKKKEIDLESC